MVSTHSIGGGPVATPASRRRAFAAAWRARRAPLARVLRALADRFPLTLPGVVLVAGGIVAFVTYGLHRVDLLLLVIGLVGLGAAAISVLLVGAFSTFLWWRLRRATNESALRVECGVPTRTGFTLRVPWWVPLVSVRWSWQSPPTEATGVGRWGRLAEQVTPTRRALADTVVRRFEVGDAFGLARIAFAGRETRQIRFAPSVGALERVPVVRGMAAGDEVYHPAGPSAGDRADLRRYAAGDPVRFILWKAFARTRKLVVRTPERALSPSPRTAAYAVAGERDEAAAGAARLAVESGALGSRWVLGADGSEHDARSSAEAVELLAGSSRVEEREGGAGLRAFLERATHGAGERVMVFVPPVAGPWVERVTAAVAGRARYGGTSTVTFLVCSDGVRWRERGSTLKRLALREGSAGGANALAADADELAALVARLRAVGGQVRIVDRRGGRIYEGLPRRPAGTTSE